jgi:hypothetical protein
MSLPTVSDVRRNVRNERPLLIFYVGMVAAMVILLDNAATLDEAAARIPRYVIMGTLLVLGIHVFFILLGQRIKGFQGTDVDDFADEDVNMSDVNLPALIKEMLWICAYVAGLFYIGFFTTTFIFVYIYIVVKDLETKGIQRFVVSGIWAAGITGLLYVLIVQVLKNYSFLRLGMLP